jgi:hypothetical protein
MLRFHRNARQAMTRRLLLPPRGWRSGKRIRSVERDPDSEEPVTPTAVKPVEDGNDGKAVVGERTEITLRIAHIARRPAPWAVPPTRRRRTVPSTLRRGALPVWRRVARSRAVVPAVAALRRRWRRTAARNAEANGDVDGATDVHAAARDVSTRGNVGRVRRLGARRMKDRANLSARRARRVSAWRGGVVSARRRTGLVGRRA